MDNEIKGQVVQKSLITDDYYYKYIFKKTEKIVAAVFFIISKRQNIPQDNVVRADLERRAKDTHSVALSLLNLEPEAAAYGMQTLLHSLVSLDSILRIFAAMGGISEENLATVCAEIENVQRSMRRYLGDMAYVIDRREESAGKRVAARPSTPRASSDAEPLTPSPLSVGSAGGGADTTDRAERILSVIRDTDGAGIKDIAQVVSDVSEKTIQRELLSLMEKDLVRREGERRWSRYYVA